MPNTWSSKQLSPFTVYVTLLVVIAAIIAIAMIAVMRAAPPEEHGVLPFPSSQLDYYRLDDTAGHHHLPGYSAWVDWPEHPAGGFEMRTNNLGFREDEPTLAAKPSGVVRILVTGDSHTDGVVANPESFANRLETLLNERAGRERFEVINGGHGHYGPQNYRGLLELHRGLDLDAFIVVVFTGNDFLNAVSHEWAKGRLELPERPDGYLDRLKRAEAISGESVSQGLNQAFFMKTFPELEQRSLEITIRELDRIDRICADNRITPYVVLLPTKIAVEPATIDGLAEAVAALGLDRRALGLDRRLAAALAAGLDERGIAVLDLTHAFETSDTELYWRRDHHLDVAGHLLAAERFAARFGGGLADRFRAAPGAMEDPEAPGS